MLCAKAMIVNGCGQDQAKNLNTASLSNDMIRKRVNDIAKDIIARVIEEVKFCSQFDESTNISSWCSSAGIHSLRSLIHDQRQISPVQKSYMPSKGMYMLNL